MPSAPQNPSQEITVFKLTVEGYSKAKVSRGIEAQACHSIKWSSYQERGVSMT
jgi:hypothetical protein